LHETDCLARGATIRYLVDSSVLNVLEHKKKLLQSLQPWGKRTA
jgi:hypothetical protein